MFWLREYSLKVCFIYFLDTILRSVACHLFIICTIIVNTLHIVPLFAGVFATNSQIQIAHFQKCCLYKCVYS